MKYKFDEIIDRSRTNSFKWKARELKNNGHEMYPMWVADMEFDASPAIQKRLADRVKEGVFGYELLSEDYYKAVQYWLKKRHGCEIPEGQIVYCANMMSGLSIILQEYTEEQDEVMMNVPTYGNFYHTIEGCGRAVNGSKLREQKHFCCVIRIIRQELYGQNRNWKESVGFARHMNYLLFRMRRIMILCFTDSIQC